MVTLAELQTDLDAARAARLSVLQDGQKGGKGDRSLEAANLAELNRTIRDLMLQIALMRQSTRGYGSLSGRVINPGGSA